MAAEWVDVTGPTFWESAEATGFGTLVSPDPDPVVWDGTQWVWESYYQKKGFVWVNAAEVFASAIRLTYTMPNAYDPPGAKVWLNNGDEYSDRTFSWYVTPQPDSGVDLPLDDTYSMFGFAFRVGYETGYLTKIELFMEPFSQLPKQLIIEDGLGTILHTRDLSSYSEGIHNLDYYLDYSDLSGKIKIYTTGMYPDLVKILNITCVIPIVTKYQNLSWSVGNPTLYKEQNLNWVIGPNSYHLPGDLNWSTTPIQTLQQELNWGTRPLIVKNVDIYYAIAPTIWQDLAWAVSPQIVQNLTWSTGNIIRQNINWSIANIIRPQISWSVTNDSVVSDLNWSIRQWNTQDVSWEVE